MTTREFIEDFVSTHGRPPSQVELVKKTNLPSRAALQALVQYTKEKRVEKKEEIKIKTQRHYILWALKIFLLLLSTMAFILSVYFTRLWFYGRFSAFISGTISLTMVLFMVVSPQTIRYIKSWFIKGITILSFLIALLFSMVSTVAGQYNKTTERMETTVDRSYVFDQLQTQEEELLLMIEEAQKDKLVHQETIVSLSSSEENRLTNWQSIATERKYISKYDERIDELRVELGDIRGSKIDNGVVEEKRDFYSFVSGIFGIEDITFTEFILAAAPAIFIDLVSTLCLNLALFIRKEK